MWCIHQNYKIDALESLDPLFNSVLSKYKITCILKINSFWFKGCLGMVAPLGHVDFYPDGGEHQDGCEPNVGGDIVDMARKCIITFKKSTRICYQ